MAFNKNMKKIRIVTQKFGMSLIEVIISIGVMSILASAFVTMLSNQGKELKSVSETLGALDLSKTLITALANGKVCSYILNNPTVLTFNSVAVVSSPQVMTPSEPIYASVELTTPVITGPIVAKVGEVASAYSNSLFVDNIKLEINKSPAPSAPGPGKVYVGDWVVSFDRNKLVRALKPIRVTSVLTVDTTSPTAAVVTACSSSGGGTASLGQPVLEDSYYAAISGSKVIGNYKMCYITGYSFCGWNSACRLSHTAYSGGTAIWTVIANSSSGGGCAPTGAGCTYACY